MRFDRRISRRSFLAAAGVTSAALALTACGGSSSSVAASSASGTASSAAGTAQGGTLNIMLETEVQSLDPQIATDGTSFEVIADYTDGLMQMDADGAAVPAIAETYDISEDGKTYTFHLRDAKWSNGDAVTAADFVFGWQRAVDPANAPSIPICFLISVRWSTLPRSLPAKSLSPIWASPQWTTRRWRSS